MLAQEVWAVGNDIQGCCEGVHLASDCVYTCATKSSFSKVFLKTSTGSERKKRKDYAGRRESKKLMVNPSFPSGSRMSAIKWTTATKCTSFSWCMVLKAASQALPGQKAWQET